MNNNSEHKPLTSIRSSPLIKVAMADYHALFRTGVKTSLQSRKDIQIVAEAGNGMQLLKLLQHIQPDIVLLDIQMPIMDGLTTLPEIKKLYPNVKVIMLSMHNDHSVISKMMEIGASCYLTKNSGSEMIYEAVKGVFENGFFFNELTNNALLSGLRTQRSSESSLPQNVQFTDTEVAILKLMVNEKSTKEIADIVDLSPRTVEAIRDKLKTKTGVKSMAGLVMYAIKAGILDNQLEETFSSLSMEQITSLFKISTSILSYVNHDLAGQRASIYNSLDQLKEEIQGKGKEEINIAKSLEHIERALAATGAVSSINNLIKSYANLNKSKSQDAFSKLFIASPFEIVASIQGRLKNANIKSLSSDNELEILYPKVILSSILSELAENAMKNTEGDLDLLFEWSMKDKTFQCEIHDNGPGFNGLKEKQFVPMTFLSLEHPGMGLKIIERTIIDSGGRLFFSKSDLLNGAKIYFEFPVFDFTSRNT